MHPQIMQPEAGDCPICGMDLIPAASSADGLLADQFKLTANAMALANIQTSIVGNGKVDRPTIAARNRARLASRFAVCAARKSPAHFVTYVSDLISSAKNHLPRIETQTWAFYTHAVASDFREGSPYFSVEKMLEETAKNLNITTTQCEESIIETQAQEAFSHLKTLRGKINVPFYRFNGQYYYDATAHKKLKSDINAYISSISANSE